MSQADLVLVTNPDDSAIATYRLEGGILEPLAVNGGLPGTGTFAVDEQRDLVHVGVKGDPAGIATLALDRASGVLTPLSRIDVEASMAYLALAAGGTLVLGASYGGGYGSVWPVDETGRLGDPVARIEFPHLHSAWATDGYAYFVSLGAALIAQYALAPDGALTPLDPPTVAAPAGSGPRHLTLSPDGRNVYVLTEFSGEAIRFARDVASGVLTRAEAVPPTTPPADSGTASSVPTRSSTTTSGAPTCTSPRTAVGCCAPSARNPPSPSSTSPPMAVCGSR